VSCFPQIEKINLRYNDISDIGDIAPLRTLNIKFIDLRNNKLTDVVGMEKWVSGAEEIWLDHNEIEKADFSHFKKLRVVAIPDNKLTEIPNFTLSLEKINFEQNNVRTANSFDRLPMSVNLIKFKGLTSLPEHVHDAVIKTLKKKFPNAELN
jgi:Leucine-rich repeat (LRR) protein